MGSAPRQLVHRGSISVTRPRDGTCACTPVDSAGVMQALSESVLAVQDGRRFVAAQLQQHGIDDQATDVTTLLVSELITNALRHGPPPLCLQVVVLADRVRLEVHD